MGRPATGNAKTAAERMAAFRARRAGDAEQLNVFLPPEAMAVLRRLVDHAGSTQAEVLANIIMQAEADALATMPPAERKAYRASD
jgi:hypothetical protein